MLKIGDELKQCIQNCASVTVDTCAVLAAAGTTCIYSGADSIGPGLTLLVVSAVTGEIASSYADLVVPLPQGDMYEVKNFDTMPLTLHKVESEFEIALQDLCKHLLYLCASLHNVHLSFSRLRGVEKVLEENRSDPQSSIHQDAQLYSVLHTQALWRNLALCTRLHTDILFRTPRLNLLWHAQLGNLRSQERMSYQEISKIALNIWQVRSTDIAEYHLQSFGVAGLDKALQLVKQKQQLPSPLLLFSGEWHRDTHLLERALHNLINNFYRETEDTTGQ